MDERMDLGKGLSKILQGNPKRNGRFRLLIQAIPMASFWLFVGGSGLLGD